MADLNINVLEYSVPHEDSGQNLVLNGDFETSPPFTAATTGSNVFVDGTSAGSATNSTYRWALSINSAAFQVQFDSSVSHTGANSLKLSCTNTIGRGLAFMGNPSAGSIPNQLIRALMIPVVPNALYTISAWIKTNNAASGAVLGQWQRFDSSYAGLGTFSIFNTNNGTQDWTFQKNSISLGASDAYANVRLLNNTAGNISDAWFDDVTILMVTPQGQIQVPLTPIVAPGIQNIIGPKIWS